MLSLGRVYDVYINKHLLIVSGFLLAVLAIGGKTWDDSNTRLFGKITRRGRVSLFILFLSLGLGKAKEVVNNKNDKKKDITIKIIKRELSETKKTLKESHEVISELNHNITQTPSTLVEFEKSAWFDLWGGRFSNALDKYSRALSIKYLLNIE